MDQDFQDENFEDEAPELPAEMVLEIVKQMPFKDQLQCRLIWPEFDEFIRDFLEGQLKPLLLHPWKNEGFIKHLEANPDAPIPNELHLESGSIEEAEKIKEVCEIVRAQGRKIKTLKVNFNKNNSAELQRLQKAMDENYAEKYLAANSDLLMSVLQIFGSTLETLELVEFPTGYAVHLKENQTPILLPALTKITLPKLSDKINKGQPKEFSPWFQRLFQAAPKLKWIKEIGYKPAYGFNHAYPVNILNDLQISQRLCKISSVNISVLTEGHLDTILELGDSLFLQELILNEFKTKGEKTGKFQKVLEILQKKLMKLDLSVGKGNAVSVKFPVMQKLTHFGFDANLLHFENLFWKTDFPKLKYLEIRRVKGVYGYTTEYTPGLTPAHWLSTFSIEENPQPCTTVEVMKIDLGVGEKAPLIIDGECCSSLGAIFPCVKTLTLVNPSGEFLKGFSSGWQNLTKLELILLSYIGDLDQHLFGMSPEWKKALGEVDMRKDGCWTSTNASGEPAWTICNLQKLKILKVKIHWKCSGLTEFAFFFGLVRLTNLETLDLTLPANCEISENASNFLKTERPGLVIVIRRE